MSYQEFSNLNAPLRLVAGSGNLRLSPDGHATRWVDCLVPDDAEVLAGYDHPHFGQFAALTTRAHAGGRVTTVGTVPDLVLARDLMRWLVPDPHPGWPELPASVTLSSATNRAGERVHVLHNWGWTPVVVTPPAGLVDLLAPGPDPVAPGPVGTVPLGAWDVRVLRETSPGGAGPRP